MQKGWALMFRSYVIPATAGFAVHLQRPAANPVNVFKMLNDYSFPTGCVPLLTVFVGSLLLHIRALTPCSWGQNCVLILLGSRVALLGVSPVYLGKHWPSDVIGAYLLGTLWLALTIYLYRNGRTRILCISRWLAASDPQLKNDRNY
ncbi:MAG TPA: phosphatase PAP2 family protein [Verrucomicrobiae bacterium]|nr:phosphatase PAP2 family protein [Verrucomicrobiae bacterium]